MYIYYIVFVIYIYLYIYRIYHFIVHGLIDSWFTICAYKYITHDYRHQGFNGFPMSYEHVIFGRFISGCPMILFGWVPRTLIQRSDASVVRSCFASNFI